MNNNDGFWSERRTALLTSMWAEGVATREIGRQLNCTKNAAIGKAHRLDLPPHVNGTVYRPIVRAEPAWWGQIREGGCSYDIGDGNVFSFCGAELRPGSSYCCEHHAIVWRAPPAAPKVAA